MINRIKAFPCSLPVTSGHTLFMMFCQTELFPTQWLPEEMNLPMSSVIYYSHYLESFLFRQERPSISIHVGRESWENVILKKGRYLACVYEVSPASDRTSDCRTRFHHSEGTCSRTLFFCDPAYIFLF